MQHRIQWSAQKVGPTAKQVQSALQHTIEYNAIQCNIMQYNAIQWNVMQQYNATYNTMQYNLMWSTMQDTAGGLVWGAKRSKVAPPREIWLDEILPNTINLRQGFKSQKHTRVNISYEIQKKCKRKMFSWTVCIWNHLAGIMWKSWQQTPCDKICCAVWPRFPIDLKHICLKHKTYFSGTKKIQIEICKISDFYPRWVDSKWIKLPSP